MLRLPLGALRTTPGNATSVEVWNGPWSVHNQESLLLFYHWLDEGQRIVATSGTDLHGPPPPDVRGAVNVVYAEDLTEGAIIAAIEVVCPHQRRANTAAGTQSPTPGREGMIGDTLPPEAAMLRIRWSGAHPGDDVRLVVNGRAYHDQLVGEAGVRWSGRWWPARRSGVRRNCATATTACGR